MRYERGCRRAVSVLLILALMIPLTGIYAAGIDTPPPEAIKGNEAFFSWFLGVILVICICLFARLIVHHEQNNKKQWEKIDSHEDRLTENEKDVIRLQTEHDIRTKMGMSCDTPSCGIQFVTPAAERSPRQP